MMSICWAKKTARSMRKTLKAPRWRDFAGPMLWCLLVIILPRPADAALRIGDILPSITLPSLNGTPITIPEAVKGKVIILHFWQIGCSSCKLEIPAMEVLYKKYQRKGLEILAVNVGQEKESVKSFASDLMVSYPILLDTERKSAAIYGVTDVPRTYIIDRSGVVRYRIFGGATQEMLKKLVLSLL